MFKSAWCLVRLCQQTWEYVCYLSGSPSTFSYPRVTERGIWPQRARDRLAVCLSLFVYRFLGCSHTTKLPWVICLGSFSCGLLVIKGRHTRRINNLCCSGRRWYGMNPLWIVRASGISVYLSQVHIPPPASLLWWTSSIATVRKACLISQETPLAAAW